MPFVLFCYRSAQAHTPGACHVGLGLNALHAVKCLRRQGVAADLFPVANGVDISRKLHTTVGVTHAVIEAPWLGTNSLLEILTAHPQIQFVVRCHSQIGFLQVEAGAIRLMREQLRLSEERLNFRVAVNSDRLARFLEQVYRSYVLVLPNLYDSERVHRNPWQVPGSPVRIGSLGATRLMKNHLTAAAAALMLAAARRWSLEFSVSTHREENGKGVIQALRNLFAGVPWAKLVEVPWQPWPEFRQTVAHLHLGIQVSMSETFNITTADLTAEGVPSVVSDAIDWAPHRWRAPIDDAEVIARVGDSLLYDHQAASDGLRALETHVQTALGKWLAWLQGK